MSKLLTGIEEIINLVCIDERVSDGVFEISNPSHLEVFSEYLTESYGEEFSREYISAISLLTEAGKYPERQAYNRDGYLVTFPDPNYKRRALKNGTHYEKDPTGKHKDINATTPDEVTAPQGSSPDEEDVESKPSEGGDQNQSSLPTADGAENPSGNGVDDEAIDDTDGEDSESVGVKPSSSGGGSSSSVSPDSGTGGDDVTPSVGGAVSANGESIDDNNDDNFNTPDKQEIQPESPAQLDAQAQNYETLYAQGDWTKDPEATKAYALALRWTLDDANNWWDAHGVFRAYTRNDAVIIPVSGGCKKIVGQWPAKASVPTTVEPSL